MRIGFIAYPHLRGWCLALALALPTVVAQASGAAAIELQANVSSRPLKLNRLGQLTDQRRRALSVTRLDLLLSNFSLQRTDGSWARSDNWHAFFRAEQPMQRQLLPSLSPGDYVAVRFDVGVGREANHADTNRLGPDDPLHPIVNGLHWGWMGGYVFMALEGHWQYDRAPRGRTGGYSYHLAGDDNLVTVTLPAKISLRPGTVLRLSLDVRRLLGELDVARDGDSTHSRQQDILVRALKNGLGTGFSVEQVPDGFPEASRGASPQRKRPVGQPYPVSIGPHMPSLAWPEDNRPTVEGVALGRLLFHDARLSSDGSVSCASCHREGHALADGGRAVSAGVRQQPGTRNTMPLFNLAWAREFFWDGRARSLREQAVMPIQDPHEMAETLPRVVRRLSADRALADRFARVFTGPVTAERVGLALEQFMLTLVSQDSKFDRVMKGSERFTPAEKRGFELFLTEHDPRNGLFGADCFHCHGGALFTNHQFMNNGLSLRRGDTGREKVTGDATDRGKFRTPSLRNVALTAPYMHDGRFKTLDEVVEHYDHGVERQPTLDPNLAKHPIEGLRLSNEDKAAIVEFLRTLTDPAMANAATTATTTTRPKPLLH